MHLLQEQGHYKDHHYQYDNNNEEVQTAPSTSATHFYPHPPFIRNPTTELISKAAISAGTIFSSIVSKIICSKSAEAI
jgi:hypothetical protein